MIYLLRMKYCFRFQKGFQTKFSKFSSNSGLLKATEGSSRLINKAVDRNSASLKLLCYSLCSFYVCASNISMQTITGIVCYPNCISIVFKSDNRQYRPKNFFLSNGHVIVYFNKDRRFNKITFL